MQQPHRPNYQQSLGAIGRYLDKNGYEGLLLCELSDGYVVRAVKADSLPEAIPFQATDLDELVQELLDSKKRWRERSKITAKLTGSFIQRTAGSYQLVLSSLGQQFDDLQASMLLVMELTDAVLVSYRTLVATMNTWDNLQNEYIYDDRGIRTLLQQNS